MEATSEKNHIEYFESIPDEDWKRIANHPVQGVNLASFNNYSCVRFMTLVHIEQMTRIFAEKLS